MAKKLKLRVQDAADSLSVFVPDVKTGDAAAANYVLSKLNINASDLHLADAQTEENVMPNAVGMGARDAVYLLERQGIKVQLHGMGHVKRQSVAAGTALHPGMVCVLELEQ